MSKPQQPELHRSRRTPADHDSREDPDLASEGEQPGGSTPRVPKDNRPGHHPEREQDKPEELGGAGHGKNPSK